MIQTEQIQNNQLLKVCCISSIESPDVKFVVFLFQLEWWVEWRVNHFGWATSLKDPQKMSPLPRNLENEALMKYAGSKLSFSVSLKNIHPTKRVCNLPSRQIQVFILRLLGVSSEWKPSHKVSLQSFVCFILKRQTSCFGVKTSSMT